MTAHMCPDIDLAVVHLKDFDMSGVPEFPTIKDGSKAVDPGSSCYRIGFPFSSIQATFDDASQSFNFPPGSLPLPLFPIEGMLTREIIIRRDPPSPFPLQMIETSSPGLKGQSGGPILDTTGTVCGHPIGNLALCARF